MKQNTSSAVMQQRREPHDSLDDFPTPPWATRALCEWLRREWCPEPGDWPSFTCREPAANRGHMVRPLSEYFGRVEGSDVHDYGAGFAVRDFLFPTPLETVDWTITNPPFRLAEEFVRRALETSRHGVAMIVRSAFLEGQTRYQRLFSQQPPAAILQFTERVVMLKGRLANPEDSSATAYCWLVWIAGSDPDPRFHWIPPCRKRLERPTDFAQEAQAA